MAARANRVGGGFGEMVVLEVCGGVKAGGCAGGWVVAVSLCIIQIILKQSMEEQSESSSEEVQFSQEEVVWAKITGYPWWPALITASPSTGTGPFRVDFFADNTHAFVARSKLAKYQLLRGEVDLHKHMKKGLRKAIASADQAIRDRCDPSPSLPLFREAVEAISPTQKQLLQLPSIKTTPLQEKRQQLPPLQALPPTPPSQTIQEEQSQEEEEPQQPTHMQYSYEKRQKYVSFLLKKYELDNLTRITDGQHRHACSRSKQGRGIKKRENVSRRQKAKTKRITKLLNHSQQHRPTMLFLLSRRLHKFLKGKAELCESQRKAIILSLSKQVQSHHLCLENSVEEVTKLLKWLQITPVNTIASYYECWSSFQTEKEKASSMTNEE